MTQLVIVQSHFNGVVANRISSISEYVENVLLPKNLQHNVLLPKSVRHNVKIA